MNNKIKLTIVLVMYICINLNSQNSELHLIDIHDQEDVVIQLETNDSSDPNYLNMMMGVNQSNEGWIRTLSNNNLNFFTNNLKRLNVKPDGRVALGSFQRQKFDISSGRLRIETDASTITGFDLVGNTIADFKGGLAFAPTKGEIILGTLEKANLIFKSDDVTHMTIEHTGHIYIPDLSGNSAAPLLATASGKLIRGTIGPNEVNFIENLTAGNFQRFDHHFSEFGPNQFRGTSNPVDTPQNVESIAFAPINIPAGSIIKKVIINYIDRDIMDLSVRMIRSDNDSVNNLENDLLFTSTGMPSSNFNDVQVETVDINNWVVGAESAEKTNIYITMKGNHLGISSIEIEYTFLENLN